MRSDHPAVAPPFVVSRRRGARIGRAFGAATAATALALSTLWLTMQTNERAKPVVPAPVVQPSQARSAVGDAYRIDFPRWALNALLVPLLDDADPPRWNDAALSLLCGPDTTVEVDGRPMVPGAVVPARAFTVRWDIDRCWPLGYVSAELSGVVELTVFHEDLGMTAIVDATGDARPLRVTSMDGDVTRFDRPFAAALSLAPTQRGP